jgi:hypothetical protein
MQAWEYTILCWHKKGKRWSCPSVKGLEIKSTDEDWEIANRLGGAGWELVGLEPDGGLWFKRPKDWPGGDGSGFRPSATAKKADATA